MGSPGDLFLGWKEYTALGSGGPSLLLLSCIFSGGVSVSARKRRACESSSFCVTGISEGPEEQARNEK